MKVYEFNVQGMSEVAAWHAAALERSATVDDLEMLSHDAPLITPIGEASDELVPETAPSSRFEAAELLFTHLHPLVEAQDLRPSSNDGFWTWLAARWADHLVKPSGSVGELARWVSQLGNSRRYYRHLLAAPYLLYAAHADGPDRVRFLLANPLHTPGEFAGQVGASTGLASSKAALEVASQLYWDSAAGKPRRGVRSKGAGSARRLSRVMNQFERTYSLTDIQSTGLAELLPDEFAAP